MTEKVLQSMRMQKISVDRQIEEIERAHPRDKRAKRVQQTLDQLYGVSSSLLLTTLRVERVTMMERMVNTMKNAAGAVDKVQKLCETMPIATIQEYARESAVLKMREEQAMDVLDTALPEVEDDEDVCMPPPPVDLKNGVAPRIGSGSSAVDRQSQPAAQPETARKRVQTVLR